MNNFSDTLKKLSTFWICSLHFEYVLHILNLFYTFWICSTHFEFVLHFFWFFFYIFAKRNFYYGLSVVKKVSIKPCYKWYFLQSFFQSGSIGKISKHSWNDNSYIVIKLSICVVKITFHTFLILWKLHSINFRTSFSG